MNDCDKLSRGIKVWQGKIIFFSSKMWCTWCFEVQVHFLRWIWGRYWLLAKFVQSTWYLIQPRLRPLWSVSWVPCCRWTWPWRTILNQHLKNFPKNRSVSRPRVALGIECCGGMRPMVIMARVPKIQLIGVPRLVKQILSSYNVGFKQSLDMDI